MVSDYEAIKADNQKRYGTDVGRYGKSLLADLYDDRTHFIYELLQNAEDALRRRDDEPHTWTVRFDLSECALRVSHYGKPFDRRDVEGVCGIALSTREGDLTRIGRFGIGFKSVYGFTDRPEIHSGDEDFGIDSFVWPSAQPAIERDRHDQTIFVMPLSDPEENGAEIAEGLRRINLDTLLFLRKVDSIEWSLPSGESGTCVRQCMSVGDHVRQVTLTGEATGHDDIDQDWLVFSKPMHGDGREAGHVEVAFLMEDNHILPVSRSPLVVFFPTAVETNLGLRVQGPYRTTPSRDNVPKGDSWNQECVEKTAGLLVDALLWLREKEMLDVDVLRCLPLDEAKFGDNSMFRPLYVAIKRALRSKKLLPALGGGYARADGAKLGRSSELRELINGKRLKQLFEASRSVSWLTELISQDRTPEIRRYLMEELDVEEITPQSVLQRLGTSFLDRQSNAWMRHLYEFLNGQLALHRQAKALPIVRLSDDTHVPASLDGEPQAFLPRGGETGFPTVHREVCSSEISRQFLKSIGLSEPHLVDDVIRNILPKYDGDTCKSDVDYANDVKRILEAFQTKDSDKRHELTEHLQRTQFVRAVCTSDGIESWAAPNKLYLPTERLKTLFDEVTGIKIVDDRDHALVGDGIRDLLESCGASRGFLPISSTSFPRDAKSNDFLEQLREKKDQKETSGRNDTVTDWTLGGLDQVLEQLPRLDVEMRHEKAKYIWEELIQLEDRRGKGIFRGEYSWTYRGKYRQGFDSAFVQTLNASAWIPDENGELQRPELVLFESLDWHDSPFLLSKIPFKAPIVDQLAAEAGFEPAMLDRLKVLGITSLADLERLELPASSEGVPEVNSVEDAMNALEVPEADSPNVDDPSNEPRNPGGGGGRASGAMSGGHGRPSGSPSSRPSHGSPQKGGARHFHSYVAVDHENDGDPDGLVHEERMVLEKDAIELILRVEPYWQTTPLNNEGFDLVQVADDGRESAWCEVKAMKISLQDRPATMSHAQFKYAQKHGDAYWLYVVEHAGSEDARIVRIQDPAGKAKTFTFDKGWLDVAKVD